MEAALSSLFKRYLELLFDKIQTDHKISKETLWNISNTISICSDDIKVISKTSKPRVKTDNSKYSESYLRKCTKVELVEMCRLKNHKVTGTKDELVKRIMGVGIVPSIQKIMTAKPTITITTNQFGNKVHLPTQLVFSDEKIVIGIQNDNGSIGDLTSDAIEMCNQHKFKYKLPLNLDNTSESDDIDRITNIIKDEKQASDQKHQ
jgi:hypothetical protein